MRTSLGRALRATVATLAAAALVLLSVPFAANAAAGDSTITVKVGGIRTGAGNGTVGGLAGVQLQLYTATNNSTDSPGAAVGQPWSVCTSIASGDCVFTVPSTGNGGVNNNKRFWVGAVSASGTNYINPTLVTGDGNSSGDDELAQTPYVWRTPQLSEDAVTLPNESGMPSNSHVGPPVNDDVSTSNRWDTTGAWPASIANPRYQPTCQAGLKVGILFDLSASMAGAGITGAHAAGVALVDALVDSGAQLGLYTFGTIAPKSGGADGQNHELVAVTSANAATLKSQINAYDSSGQNYTNWDRGLYQLVAKDLDVAIVLTDGNPTAYQNPAVTPASGIFTKFQQIEAAVFSANAVKNQGAQIITFGVGDGISQDGANLRATSGPLEWDGSSQITNFDFARTNDWNLVKTQVAAIAKSLTCQVPITVTKVEKLINGTTQPGNNWTFGAVKTGSGTLSGNASQATGANGAGPAWNVTFSQAAQTANVTITETVKSGWDFSTVVCTNNGQPIATTGSAPAFTLSGIKTGDSIACTVTNLQQQTNVKVNKVWIVNGTTYNDPSQLPASLQAQLKLQAIGSSSMTDQAWGVSRDGYAINSTVKITEEQKGSWPPLCTWNTGVINGPGATNVNVKGATFTSGALPQGLTTYTITNVVTCDTTLKLVKTVLNPNGGTATPSNWTLNYAGATSGTIASGDTKSLAPGAYTISESGGPSGYTQTGLACSSGLTGTSVTLVIGTATTCTFTNTDSPASLTLQKIVVGAPGVGPENWTLTAKDGAATVLTGNGSATGSVTANKPFTLSEAAINGISQSDFTASAWECRTGPTGPFLPLTNGALGGLPPGSSTLCRITNTAKTADPAITKTVTSVVSNPNGSWTVIYDVTVKNPSKFTGITYNLTDTLAFGAGITPSATATGPSGPIAGWNGVANTTLATGVALAANGQHSYTVTAIATLAPGITPANLVCPSTAPSGGFLNKADLVVAGVHYPAQACAEPVIPTFSKSPGSVTDNGNGTWTATYTLSVNNSGTKAVYYDLSDTPNFPTGVTTVSGTVTPGGSFTGGVIVDDKSLAAGGTDNYTVAFVIKIASTVTAAALQCTGGNGLDNDAVVKASGQTLADDACLTVTLPSVTHQKTVTSSLQNSDGTWTVKYDVAVTNTGPGTGVYSLTDEPKMTVAGVLSVVGTPTASGPSSGAATWNGTSNKVLATDQPIPSATVQHYTITVVVKVADDAIDDPAARCAGADGTNGFLNEATITVKGVPATDDACATPEIPSFKKDAGSVTDNGDGTFTVTYTLTATNGTASPLYYDLSDTPDFPSGVTIQSGTVTPPGTPFTGGTIATGVQIPANDTDVYTVSLVIAIGADVPAEDLQCGDGTGLQNDGTLVSGGQTLTDDACLSLDMPVITHEKTVSSAAQNSDGTWTIVYEVVVTNESPFAGRYTLDDTLEIAVPGVLSIVGTPTATGPGGSIPAWDGTANTRLATDQLLNGAAIATYTVTVIADVAEGGLDDEGAFCADDDGTNGFLNTSLLTVAGVGTEDSACASPSGPKLTKELVSVIPTGAGTWKVTYRVTVDNTSADAKDNYYTLTDTLGFPADVTSGTPAVTLTSVDPDVDVPWNDGKLVETPKLIEANTSDVYEIVIDATVPAGAEDLECVEQTPGHGFYNHAAAAVGNDILEDDACGDVTESAIPTIDKTVVDGYPKQQADGSWLVRYDVTVTGDADLATTYDLEDTLDGFGGGILIGSSDLVVSPPGVTVEDWNGLDKTDVANDVTLPADGVHVFTFEVVATVPAGAWEDDDDVCKTGDPTPDGGFLNSAILTSGKADPREAEACAEPAQPTISKIVDPNSPPKLNQDGTWTVTYLLEAENPSELQLSYDLDDEFDFAPGLTLSEGTVTSADVTVDPDWDGVVDTSIVAGQLIDPLTTHSFKVTVKATVTDSFDPDEATCTDEPGSGLFNGAVLTSGGIPFDADACADLPIAELTLVKVVDNTEFDGIDDLPALAQKTDWTLKAVGSQKTVEGITGTPSVTTVLVPVGTYTLSELPIADPSSDLLPYYTASDWSCTDDDQIVVEPGDSVTCTITNTGHPVDLKIVKSDGGAVIDQGDSYSYTFDVDNNGVVATQKTVVTDVIPGTLRVDFPMTVPLGWDVALIGEDSDGFGGTLTFTKSGPFDVGGHATFVFQVSSAADLPREGGSPTGRILDIENTATVGSSGVEETPEDNTSTEVTPVKSVAIEISGTCTLNAPFATWAITPYNTPASDEVAIIWWTPAAFAARNPDLPVSNPAAILADGALQVDVLPMPGGGWTSGDEQTGSQLWAGATIDPVTHKGTGWPGYALVNGQWKLDPTNKFYPIRNSAVVEVRMNPSTGATVGYPPASINCSAFPPFEFPTLALTGAAGVAAWIVASGIFLLFGVIFVAAARRRVGRHSV